jgi:hypothetical protein
MNHAIRQMVNRWPSSLVARAEVKTFSGGVISGRYLANLDSAGEGPPGAFRVGGKVVYPPYPVRLKTAARSPYGTVH